ncbi:hypothetical protein, variant 2 [Phytophthora nicotianae P1976]|uniref:Uncharacterized protein n=1 Tax=Phytophthora nicotianae P1976 TaxID=1317066 RepID=A0A081A280_PHYNI|nr:hypothetical protein F444_11039 [Phytophthora nicotianae P1976]ETO72992.1 hypothetical protein, variant 1 [Phytophthora nicotianae P1976]ETO72993.1 hypothetical protein, variant 2 [Phytophthora nicotianae P1976]
MSSKPAITVMVSDTILSRSKAPKMAPVERPTAWTLPFPPRKWERMYLHTTIMSSTSREMSLSVNRSSSSEPGTPPKLKVRKIFFLSFWFTQNPASLAGTREAKSTLVGCTPMSGNPWRYTIASSKTSGDLSLYSSCVAIIASSLRLALVEVSAAGTSMRTWRRCIVFVDPNLDVSCEKRIY